MVQAELISYQVGVRDGVGRAAVALDANMCTSCVSKFNLSKGGILGSTL